MLTCCHGYFDTSKVRGCSGSSADTKLRGVQLALEMTALATVRCTAVPQLKPLMLSAAAHTITSE